MSDDERLERGRAQGRALEEGHERVEESCFGSSQDVTKLAKWVRHRSARSKRRPSTHPLFPLPKRSKVLLGNGRAQPRHRARVQLGDPRLAHAQALAEALELDVVEVMLGDDQALALG